MHSAEVVLADGHQVMLRGLKELLKHSYSIVASVSDARSLMKAVGKLKPDVAIVDVALPNDLGEGVIKQLSATQPELKTIVVSVYDEPTIVDKALSAGASGYVLKRRVASDLIPAIESVLADTEYLSPGLAAGSAR